MKKRYFALSAAILAGGVLVAGFGAFLKGRLPEDRAFLYEEHSLIALPFALMADSQLDDVLLSVKDSQDTTPVNESTGDTQADTTSEDTTVTSDQTDGTLTTDETVTTDETEVTEETSESTTAPENDSAETQQTTEATSAPTETTAPPTTTEPPATTQTPTTSQATTAPSDTTEAPTTPPETTAPPTEPTEVYPVVPDPIVSVGYFDNALFIGDSRMCGLRDYARLGDADYFCDVGMSIFNMWYTECGDYDYYPELLSERLKNKQYGKIYVALGINECGYSVGNFQSEYQKMVGMLREKQPDAIIVLQGIMTVTRGYAYGRPYFHPDHIGMLNNFIASLADGYKVFYINPNPVFADSEGYLLTSISRDGCHLYAKDHWMWAQWLMSCPPPV